MFFDIFKDYSSVAEIVKEPVLQHCLSIGKTIITLGFIPFGFVCILKAGKTGDVYGKEKKKIVSYLIGLCFIFCGLSRLTSAINFWHYYAWLDAIFSNLAGLTILILLGYIPFVLKAIKQDITLHSVQETLTKTSEKLDELKELNQKFTKKEI